MEKEKKNKLINKKFIKYLIPGLIMVLAQRIANIINSVLIGKKISTLALTAFSLASPFEYLYQFTGCVLGAGCAIMAARHLGKGETKEASDVSSVALIGSLLVGIIFAIIAYPVSGPIANALANGNKDISTLIQPAIMMYFIGAPLVAIINVVPSLMAVDNHPKLATAHMITYCVSRLLFVVITLFVINKNNDPVMGMYFTGISTAFGGLISLIPVTIYLCQKNRQLRIGFKISHPLHALKEDIVAGSTTAFMFILMVIQQLTVNVTVSKVLGNDDLMTYGLMSNFHYIFDLFILGVVNLVPQIVSVLFGSEDYRRIRTIARKASILVSAIATTLVILIAIFPQIITSIFGYDGHDIDSCYQAIRVCVIAQIFFQINSLVQAYYPCVNKNIPSLVNVVLSQGVIIIPVLLALTYAKGLMGYSIGNVVSAGSSFVITLIVIFVMNKVSKGKSKGLFMLPSDNTIDDYDITIGIDHKEATSVSLEVKNYASNHNFSERDSEAMALAAEEIITNVQDFGYEGKEDGLIDVNLRIDQKTGELLLRIRDDGKPFNPTLYEDTNEVSTSGIMLVKHLTTKMEYMRALSLNNTIIKIRKGE